MERSHGRFSYIHQEASNKTRGMTDLQNSLIFYEKTWNHWPSDTKNLYNLILQQQTRIKDSLIVSLSEFQTLGLQSDQDSVTVQYDFKDNTLGTGQFSMTKLSDSTYMVHDKLIRRLIVVRKRHYRQQ